MNKKFLVEICSDLDFEELVADISYENHTIAMITQEKGIGNMVIEIFSSKNGSWEFPLDDFIETIKFAKLKLLEDKKMSSFFNLIVNLMVKSTRNYESNFTHLRIVNIGTFL